MLVQRSSQTLVPNGQPMLIIVLTLTNLNVKKCNGIIELSGAMITIILAFEALHAS